MPSSRHQASALGASSVHHLALAVVVVAAVEPVRHAGDPPVRHGLAQPVHRVVGVHVVEMGGEAVEGPGAAVELLRRRVGGEGIDAAEVLLDDGVFLRLRVVAHRDLAGADQPDAALDKRLREARERRILEMRPLIGLLIALPDIVIARAVDIAHRFHAPLLPASARPIRRPAPACGQDGTVRIALTGRDIPGVSCFVMIRMPRIYMP